MLKKVSAWVLLLVLHVGMAWLLIAGGKFLLEGPVRSETHTQQLWSGWEKADALLSSMLPGQENALRLRTQLSLIMGNEKIGDIYIHEERLLREPEVLDEAALTETAEILNAFYQKYTIPTCIAALPAAAEIYTDFLPDHVTAVSQLSQLETFYEAMDTKIRKVNAYHVLSTFKEDYIYYRTDSRWTSYGAYVLYRNLIRKMGYYPVPYDSYTITHVKNDFRGDLYEDCLYDAVTADVLDVYTCEDSSVIKSMQSYDGESWTERAFYNQEELEQGRAENFYMGEPQLLTEIQTDVGNNKRLLVLKDSAADCMLPFLTQHYTRIDVIDMDRLDRPVTELTDPVSYQQVLILCDGDTYQNTEAFLWLTEETESGGEKND
ncbi:MAG: hypothetical protein IJ496_05245 [Ruminococcus sp.]|nr:hypothetical protein [Ruminococcus sp.]